MNEAKTPWTFEQILEWAERVAAKKGWKLNFNKEAVMKSRSKMFRYFEWEGKKEGLGEGYTPEMIQD